MGEVIFSIWMLSGFVYWFANAIVRKLDGRDDPWLNMLWLFGAPIIGIVALCVYIVDKIYKHEV